MRKYFAEAVGTFALVFAGTGAIVVDDIAKGTVTHVGVALTFGLVVLAVIYAIGEISGAHINPAVTIGFWISRRFTARDVVPYIAAQCLGAIAASLLLLGMFGGHQTLGATLPAGSAGQSLVMETVLTWLLMYVILSVSTGAKEKGLLAGVAIGSVVGLEAMFGGPVSGASMNPARSLGPALVSGTYAHLWLYFVGPILGAALAVGTCLLTHGTAATTSEQ